MFLLSPTVYTLNHFGDAAGRPDEGIRGAVEKRFRNPEQRNTMAKFIYEFLSIGFSAMRFFIWGFSPVNFNLWVFNCGFSPVDFQP
jgi:hypothetical protein